MRIPPPLRPAGWWQKSIAALTLLLLYSPPHPPTSQLQDLALRAGLAGQLEVSSLQHSPACVQGWCSAEPPCFVSILSLLRWGPKLTFCSSLALSLNLSLNLPFFCLSSGTTLSQPPQVLGHAELRNRGRDMSWNRCCRQSTVVSQPQQLKVGRTRGEQASRLTIFKPQSGQTPTLSPQVLVPKMCQVHPSTWLIPSFRPWKKLMPWSQWTPDHRARLLYSWNRRT